MTRIWLLVWLLGSQRLPAVLLEVKVTEPPAQKVSGPLAVMVGVAGCGLTVTTTVLEIDEQPALVTVTV